MEQAREGETVGSENAFGIRTCPNGETLIGIRFAGFMYFFPPFFDLKKAYKRLISSRVMYL